MPLAGEAKFPAGGTLAQQVRVGQSELAADLRGAIELARRGGSEGAEPGSRKREVRAQFAGDAEAGVEDVLAS